ncbi:hypothetical protein ACFE04_026225 [Oxalis oulophora]
MVFTSSIGISPDPFSERLARERKQTLARRADLAMAIRSTSTNIDIGTSVSTPKRKVNGQTSLTHLTKSTKVEVSIPEADIFKRAYFTATIIDTPPWPIRNCHSNEYLVQYNNMLSTDGAKDREVRGETAMTNDIDVAHILPFVKISVLWEFFESHEVFQKTPLNSHFSPLADKAKVLHEEYALGTMVKFSNIMIRIGDLRYGDPERKFDIISEILHELEEHGFDVEPITARLE